MTSPKHGNLEDAPEKTSPLKKRLLACILVRGCLYRPYKHNKEGVPNVVLKSQGQALCIYLYMSGRSGRSCLANGPKGKAPSVMLNDLMMFQNILDSNMLSPCTV